MRLTALSLRVNNLLYWLVRLHAINRDVIFKYFHSHDVPLINAVAGGKRAKKPNNNGPFQFGDLHQAQPSVAKSTPNGRMRQAASEQSNRELSQERALTPVHHIRINSLRHNDARPITRSSMTRSHSSTSSVTEDMYMKVASNSLTRATP